MSSARVLFVDDEPNLRTTLKCILQMHGFEVTTVGTVAEALDAIHGGRFEVVLSDLNIGEPGDGFTVVSATRRTQPDAVNIIITGYPDFQSALEAIRQQVDDYVVKPADSDALVDLIRTKLKYRSPRRPVPSKRVADILREHASEILREWVAAVRQAPSFAGLQLREDEITAHLPEIVGQLADMLQSHPGRTTESELSAAARHGVTRFDQGCSLPALVDEARIFHGIVLAKLQQNLLTINISYLIGDIIQISDSLGRLLQEAITAYVVAAEQRRRVDGAVA